MEVYKKRIDKLLKELDEIKFVIETGRYNTIREGKRFGQSSCKEKKDRVSEFAKISFKEEIEIHKQDIKDIDDSPREYEKAWIKDNIQYLYWDKADEWDEICQVFKNYKQTKRNKKEFHQKNSESSDEANILYSWDKADEWEEICYILRNGMERTVQPEIFWGTFPPYFSGETIGNLRCVYDNKQRLLISKKELEEAVFCAGIKQRHSSKRKGINEYELKNRLFTPIFMLQDALRQYEYCKDNYEQIEALSSEIVEWFCSNIGYNKHVGKFSVTEYSELIYERIVYLTNEATKAEIKELMRNVNHLLFRICTYLEFDVEAIKEEYKFFLDREYVDRQDIVQSNVEEDYSGDYWTDIYEMFDDYSDYAEMEDL